MKNRVILFTLLLVTLTATSWGSSCINDVVLFQGAGPSCELHVQPFFPYSVAIVATFVGHDNPVARLEFGIDNLIDNPGAPLGIALLEWGAYEIVGDAETGYLVEFDPPLAPGVDEVQLGTLTVISYDESWPLENHVMHISDPGVWDIYGQRAYTSRGYLTFNPDTWTSCLLDGDYATADTHAGNIWPPQGAEVVDLFNLDFTVNSWFCMPGSSAFFTGEILVDGLVAHTFSGEGDMGFSLPVDASGYVSGCDLQVDILLHGSREGHAEIHYEVGEATNSESTSFSVVKACY